MRALVPNAKTSTKNGRGLVDNRSITAEATELVEGTAVCGYRYLPSGLSSKIDERLHLQQSR